MNEDELYREASAAYGPALERLVYAYEADSGKRADLLQEIHVALWRSFKKFEARCSLRTWVYRIAHNAAASYITRQRRSNSRNLVSLEELDSFPNQTGPDHDTDKRLDAERLLQFIHRLKPLDRQLWIAVLIKHRKRQRNLPDDAPLTTCLQFYRKEVQRRHDHFAKTPWFFLAIIAAAGLQYGIVSWGFNPSPLNAFLYPAVLALLSFAVVLPLWRREARRLQREIDELDSFEKEDS